MKLKSTGYGEIWNTFACINSGMFAHIVGGLTILTLVFLVFITPELYESIMKGVKYSIEHVFVISQRFPGNRKTFVEICPGFHAAAKSAKFAKNWKIRQVSENQ